MSTRILITGGAGFIGSHLADELLDHGYEVRALDNLCPQVHGSGARRPDYLDDQVELVLGDVTVPDDVEEALDGVTGVVHLAAAVGVGQSMYQPVHYVRTNSLGSAVLMEALRERRVDRLVVASSMSIYGEGRYVDAEGRIARPVPRERRQLERRAWDVTDSEGEVLTPAPTSEGTPPDLTSIYALSKYDQERTGLLTGRALGIPTVALRFFNVYGPRQALSNPYTGVMAIFASRLKNGRPPIVFEDGGQMRDFVHARDVARACRMALERDGIDGDVFNVGSGTPRTVLDIAAGLARVAGTTIEPEITHEFRIGDIRHCFADVGKAAERLGYRATVDFEEGLREFAEWLDVQEPEDRVEVARQELVARGLTG